MNHAALGQTTRWPMSRSSLLWVALCLATACAPGEDRTAGGPPEPGSAGQPPADARPVFFYLIDTCRADRMGVYGYERDNTPFLSELARRGVVFERCYAQAAWTKPSMASLLTSHYPSETGVRRQFEKLDDDFLTLPEVLQSRGWHTAGFSANPFVGALSNFAQGFDVFIEAKRINRGSYDRWASGSAERLNRAVQRWLENKQPGPEFLYVHAVDPHEFYEPEERYLRQYADPVDLPQFRRDWDTLNSQDGPMLGNHLTQWDFDRHGIEAGPFIEYGSDLYDADILACDAEIRALWERLAERGWDERCIAVITADHGEEFFEHGGTSHAYSLYNELLQVPLILYAPGLVPEGIRVDRPVRLIDVYPTLLDLLGVPAPDHLRGRSLVPLMRDEGSWEDEDVYAEINGDPLGREEDQGTGVAMVLISGPWKFFSNVYSSIHRERPRYELYNLLEDPGETHNLADQRPDLVQAFQDKLSSRWAAILQSTQSSDEVDLSTLDPETLENLRQLGYLRDGP